MNQEEFTIEIEPHLVFLRNLALRKTRYHREDAEDLAQQTLLGAWKGRCEFERGTNMRGWLTTIMSRCWINTLRQSKRMKFRSVEDTCELVSPTKNPEEMLLLKEQGEVIKRVLQEMPKSRAVVLEMRERGASCKEIASFLGITVTAVKMRTFSGRKEARVRFKEAHGVDRDS